MHLSSAHDRELELQKEMAKLIGTLVSFRMTLEICVWPAEICFALMCNCCSPSFSPTLPASGENEELKAKLASEGDKLSSGVVESKIKNALEQQEQDLKNSLEGNLSRILRPEQGGVSYVCMFS